MNDYLELKEKAIGLRKNGFSYSEILKQIPVAKSTLSLWLRSVGLSKKQKQRLTKKKLIAAKKGGEAKKQQRILKTQKIFNEAKKDVNKISNRELWLMGVMLYWAEGSKEKEHNVGQGVAFSNSDPFMIKLFLKWLREVVKIDNDEIKMEIYIHQNSINNIKRVKKYWSKIINIPTSEFKYIYYKKNKISTFRKNIGKNYYGLLRIRVRRSTDLNRKITGWIEGIVKYCGVV